MKFSLKSAFQLFRIEINSRICTEHGYTRMFLCHHVKFATGVWIRKTRKSYTNTRNTVSWVKSAKQYTCSDTHAIHLVFWCLHMSTYNIIGIRHEYECILICCQSFSPWFKCTSITSEPQDSGSHREQPFDSQSNSFCFKLHTSFIGKVLF